MIGSPYLRPDPFSGEDDANRAGLEAAENFGKRKTEKEPFLRRHGMAIGAGIGSVAVIAVIAVLFITSDDAPPPRRVQELTIVNIIPPPPPPPPPQEIQPQPEPEMIEQPKMVEPEIKPEQPQEEPKEAPPEEASDEPPPGPLGLDQAAEGPGDQFNLAGNPGGRGILGGGGGGGSRWGWYATIVTQQIENALSTNPKTRHLVGQVQVRLWADGAGRISRVQLVTSSGDPEIDAIIRGQVLAGLTLREPPPADMPMPIVTRITGRRST